MDKRVSIKEIEELKKIQNEVVAPTLERKKIPLIQNKYRINGKKAEQYKINVPKKYADYLNLNKDDFIIESVLDKENKKITFTIMKNEKQKNIHGNREENH